ncbi:hypothetical protein JYU34_019217 [Plutella xylostella]|uniref:Uncharacterized protein n=2 Tax=Plutella xylostella TaxID=51655 RepID=A0ABQ7PWA7_PLUXY|nr:uncharacterized protein LOC105391586 [Plutella xylostella]KAG7297269.1 hypothetical protein JYU34_019217 [Plutella xylostella]CAG9138538.1 unnamed protein product [Plutella xylostella]
MECRGRLVLLCLSALVAAGAADLGVGMKLLGRMYDNCQRSQEIVKCFKIQAAKLADRAARMESLPIFEGVALVQRPDLGRSMPSSIPEGDLNSLSSSQVDKLLEITTSKLLSSHRLFISPATAGTDMGRSLGEARSKLKKMIGPIIAGVALKGGFLAIAFQAIALIAGKALLIGKIALLLSAIIGLKKLVSGGEAHEKTTYEIVKHPQVSQSHTYSSSHYGNDFDTTGPGGHYRRSVEDEAAAQDRAYRAYAQKQ